MSERSSHADGLLADLTDEQRDAVTTAASPLCVIAGAGSGKTRVLTRRIAYKAATGAVDPRRVLAVTFTRRAAGELRGRLRRLGLTDGPAAGTFHAIALAMLRRWWSENDRRPPRILQFRRALLSELKPRWHKSTLSAVDNEIGWARARMITPEGYLNAAAAARRRVQSQNAEAIAAAYSAYNEAKQRRKLIDFDDMLALTHRILSEDHDFAAAQRWRQRHLLVDEFQDVNPLQFEVLKAWRGDESTLVVVGDPRQAIYAWNGAEPELLAHIDRHLPGVAVVHLSVNFRSTPEICDAAGAMLGVDPQPTTRPHGDQPSVREVLGRAPAGRALSDSAPIEGVDLAGAEARSVARAVRGSHRPGARWSRQAVLARTNAQLPPIREALSAAGIPVRAPSRKGLLRVGEIEDFLSGYDGEAPLAMLLADLTAVHPGAGPAEAADPDPRSGPHAHGSDPPSGPHADTGAAWAQLSELARDSLALDPLSSVADLVDALRLGGGPAPLADGVDVSTFHQAKGLEWPIVHLVGVEDGLVPLASSRSYSARSEERRLLYVAATRAEGELHISWCRRRLLGGEAVEREASPWIEPLVADGGSPGSELAQSAARVAELREGLEAARSTDSPASDAEASGAEAVVARTNETAAAPCRGFARTPSADGGDRPPRERQHG